MYSSLYCTVGYQVPSGKEDSIAADNLMKIVGSNATVSSLSFMYDDFLDADPSGRTLLIGHYCSLDCRAWLACLRVCREKLERCNTSE